MGHVNSVLARVGGHLIKHFPKIQLPTGGCWSFDFSQYNANLKFIHPSLHPSIHPSTHSFVLSFFLFPFSFCFSFFLPFCFHSFFLSLEYIPESKGYELTRYYRTSKFNPEFSRTIATVKAITDKELKPFYLVLYKWAAGESKEFSLPRHGNAKKPTSSYFRKDPRTFTAIDNLLEEGMPTDKVYNTLIKEKTTTVSETITDPKMIENRKYKNMKAT